jgi:hypothetical protein
MNGFALMVTPQSSVETKRIGNKVINVMKASFVSEGMEKGRGGN